MIAKIAWKNIVHRPLNTILCVCLIGFGVGIISVLLLMQQQIEQKFTRDLENIDLVVGAKGSPLQLVLSSVYHLDAPTGNIKLSEAQQIMDYPMVQEAIPLAYGDTYKGYRILGTTPSYPEKYNAKLLVGRMFSEPMEAVIGSVVADQMGIKLGETFVGTHGESKGGHVHDDHPYRVVGVLRPSNSVVDQLVLTNVESVWQVHEEEGGSHASHGEDAHDHSGHDHAEHDHDAHGEDAHDHSEHDHAEHDHDAHSEDAHDHSGHDHAEHDHDAHGEDAHDHSGHDHAERDHDGHGDEADQEITAMLLQCKTKIATLSMPRVINEQTGLQAVLPALEINRLFYLLGVGTTTLRMIAFGIMAMAAFSIFFVLYNRLRARKFELALMRTVGYRPMQLFLLLLVEGAILAAIGYAFGWLLSRLGLMLVNLQAEENFNFQFSSQWMTDEFLLLLVTLLTGIGSALIPAIKAMSMDVSEILTKEK